MNRDYYKNEYSENDNYDNYNDSEVEYDSEYEEENDRIKEYEYYIKTIIMIKNSINNYVNEKSLPLCEYMTFNKVNNFISKNLK